MQIPEDLTGKRVLDIGAYDGFFSFEFERRGAEVLSVDIWTDAMWEKFQFAIEKRKSQIKHKRIDVCDLTPDEVGTFDIVFCAGVLYHLRHPLLALEAIRSVTDGLLILETVTLVPFTHERFPMIGFFPGDEEAIASGHGYGVCAGATIALIQAALRSAGFDKVECKYKPSMRWWRKMVALFTNKPQGGRGIYHAYVK
jgi:tRNA (mo5U34)-methyltransferase